MGTGPRQPPWEATSRLNWIYFSGINRRQTGEPSQISVQ